MKKIYIYGLGEGKKRLDRCLITDNVIINAYIDNFKVKSMDEIDGIKIISKNNIIEPYDYIIVTLMQYKEVKNELLKQGISSEKIICFFSFEDVNQESYWKIIDLAKWRIELMWKDYSERIRPTVNNLLYEMYAPKLLAERKIPQIVDAKRTAEIIKKDRKCLARFGDAEFEIILGRERTKYQEVDEKLRARLPQVLNSELDNLLVAIADNYGALDKYSDGGAIGIRQYLTSETREEHMKLLDMNRQYYDAYISRPYIIYRDKQNAKERFDQVIQLWENEDVLMIEGEHTRFGVGNNLFENARSVNRILTLDKNCYSVYDNILDNALKYGKDKLILITLGATATVLAYDLAQKGYWAVDIGQFDVEYEWYLRNVKSRCDIPYKTVSEVRQYGDIEGYSANKVFKDYEKEIIAYVRD